eukprot:Lankesteria_metandrocarpae@DN1908_c0_g1_i1.p1
MARNATQHTFQNVLDILNSTHSHLSVRQRPVGADRAVPALVRLLRKEYRLEVDDDHNTANTVAAASLDVKRRTVVNLNMGSHLAEHWTPQVYTDSLKLPLYFHELQHIQQRPLPPPQAQPAMSGYQNEQQQNQFYRSTSHIQNEASSNIRTGFGPGVKPIHPPQQQPQPPPQQQSPQQQPPQQQQQQFISAHSLMGGTARPTKKNESSNMNTGSDGRSNKSSNESGDRPQRDTGVREDVTMILDQLAEDGGGGEIREDILSVVLSMRTAAGELIKAEDVVGLPEIKKLLRDKIINPIRRPDLHVGLHKAPKGILLFGPPGTGKTTLAKWIAAESGAQFFEVTASALISKFHGETETLIKALFKVAEIQSPAVLFFDEIDSLLSKRRDKEEDATIRMKNQLLQVMDGVASKADKTLVVVGATNRPDMLDDAALRRLTKRVLVPLPDLESRASQISNLLKKHHSGNEQPISAEDCTKIAEMLEGWNGSDVKALCAKAADFSYDDTLALYGGIENIPSSTAFRPISVDDFLRATKVVRPTSNTAVSTDGREPPIDYNWWAETFGCL